MTKNERALIDHINKSPRLQSILYDLNLMPEQLEENSSSWHFMLGIAFADKHYMKFIIKDEKNKLEEQLHKE